jgi:ABC-type lipoprotein release transport system permease subunit
MSVLASVLFLSSSIQKDIDTSLEQQADFTVQHFKAGHLIDTPIKWVEEYLNIPGVSKVQGRVYGVHYYEPKEHSFMVVGVDFYDEQIVSQIQEFIDNIDVEEFLAKKNMIIGSGVKEFLDQYQYTKYYTFRPPDRSKEKVYIYSKLPNDSRILTNDMVLVDTSLARKILGIKDHFVTDIVLNISNPDEYQKIYEKLIISHFDTRIISKRDIQKHYTNVFNYKGGIFVVLYVISIMTFLLILYQRYSMVQTVDVREIVILKSVGWQVNEIISLKIIENFIVALFSYIFAIIIAYIYIFFLGAPLLSSIFLGDSNLQNTPIFYPAINFLDLFILFCMFILPFLLAIVIPVWRLATKEISELMR